MAKTQQTLSPRATAEIAVIGAAIGVVVGILMSDVILGVIAGFGFIALVGAIARSWTGHGGHHLTRP